jgi:phytoene dehydrogenase-like protein
MTLADWGRLGLKMLPYVLPLARWATLSAQELASRFQDPFLRRAVAQMFTWPEIPVMAGLSLLAYLHNGNAGVPVGASLEFARAIERRYLALGGQIHYQAQVEKILTEDTPDGRGKRAVGVRLYDDSIHRADYVISAADGRGTIFDLLDGEFVDRGLKRLYDGHLPMHSQVQVSLGVKRDLSTEPHWVIHLLDEPITLAGEDRYEIGVKNYCFDPSLAPAGRSVLIAMLTTHYYYWQRIYGRRLYDTEQTQVSDILIGFLEKLYPGIRAGIEVVDEATPLSYERYTGNWQGSSCGWLLTKQTMPLMIRGVRKTLPGLRNFYLAGQWVEPGGSLPLSAMSGRNAIQMICHQDGRPFVATTA